MGASWSFLFFFCLGASQGGFEIDFVAWNWIRQRPFLDSIKLQLAIGVVGLILFIPFYHHCSYDLSQCGWNSDKSSFGNVLMAIVSGFLLGFAAFGLLRTWSSLRGSAENPVLDNNTLTYSPLNMGGGGEGATMSMA
jgi:hypothetical protein